MIRGALIFGLAAAALLLIGVGTWFIYPPAAPIAVGLLIWLDLELAGRGQTR